MQIASYYASVGFNVRKQDLKAVDAALRQIQKRLELFQKNIGKSLTLPELKIKKITLDNLSAQRTLQTELNRTGRLLELRIGNVRLDQNKINSQVQNVFQRAANTARMNVRTIAGTGGGGNPYHIPRLPQMNNGGVFGAGFGGGFGGSMLPRFGPGMLGVAGIGAAGVYGAQKVGQAQDANAKAQTQLLKLRTSGSTIAGQPIEQALIGLSNEIGVAAEGQVDAFSRFLKQTKNANMTSDQGFKLFKDMSIATRGNGGDQQSIERQSYALQQLLGLGYLRSEELNQQLADSNPAIKGFIQKAYTERTGKEGTENFLRAMSKREVSVADVLRGYELSAKAAAGAVAQMADSIDGERARLENSKFSEQLSRVGSDLTGATADYVRAQGELHEAMKPLRDSFHVLAAASTSLAARFISASAKQLSQSPAFTGQPSNEQRSLAPMASSMGRGLLGVPDIRVLNQPSIPQFLSPMPVQQKEWQKAASEYSRPGIESVLQSMRPSSVSNTTTVSPGAIVIHTTAADGNALARELEPHMRELFRHEMVSVFQGVATEFPDME